MQNDTLKASVQYGDYDGTVAADRHDQRGLSDLAEKHGIDTNKYFVFGMDIFMGETRGDELAHANVSILAIDTEAVGADSLDGIQNYVDDNQGMLPYVEFGIDASLEEVLLFFKRFSIVLKNSHLKRVNQYKYTKS